MLASSETAVTVIIVIFLRDAVLSTASHFLLSWQQEKAEIQRENQDREFQVVGTSEGLLTCLDVQFCSLEPSKENF